MFLLNTLKISNLLSPTLIFKCHTILESSEYQLKHILFKWPNIKPINFTYVFSSRPNPDWSALSMCLNK